MKQSNGYWIAVGVGIGTAIGVATDNPAVWITVGITLGAIIASTVGIKKGKTDGQLK